MPLHTVAQGLASKRECVVSKRDLIQCIVGSLQKGELEAAVSLYKRSQEDIGYELMNVVGSGELARPLASLFLQAKDLYKAGQVFESLDMKSEAAESYEKAGAYEPAAELFA